MNQIVVIFQAIQQETESLALAFGLGAAQARADIRLWHLTLPQQRHSLMLVTATLRMEDPTAGT